MPAQNQPSVVPPHGQHHPSTAVGVASLLGATLFWAGNYVVGAAAVATIDPVSLVLLRWLLAAGPLILIALVTERPSWRPVLRAWPWLLGLGATGMLAYTLLLYGSLEHTSPFNASLINAFNPALIALAAAAFLRERLTPTSVLGVLLALVGVLVVLSKGDFSALMAGGFGPGELLMVAAIFVWTAYTILGRLAPPLPPVTSTAAQAVVAVVLLAPVSLALGGPAWPTQPGPLWALVFIAACPSVLSYLLWNRALTVIRPARAGVFLNLITVFTAVLTMILGQPISVAQIVGGVIVLGGVAISNANAFRRAR
ncbi:DMT family transporter [Sinomonas notoginsengisoli]|uniref:DMT family transporter n=1 Tax=Sinomonas notoginsengisoli TaxID=1457311 RepID=UPI001F38EADA|nr:DMT family transporter [Sinomonas notoginsengisoli]